MRSGRLSVTVATPSAKSHRKCFGRELRGVDAHALVPPSMVTAAPFTSRLCGRHRVRIIVADPVGMNQPAAGIHVGDRAARLFLAAAGDLGHARDRLVGHRRVDIARADRVDGEVGLGKFGGHRRASGRAGRASKPHNAPHRARRAGSRPRRRTPAGRSRSPSKSGSAACAQSNAAVRLTRDDPVPAVAGHFAERRALGDPGIDDQHLDRAVGCARLIEGAGDVVAVGDVALDGMAGHDLADGLSSGSSRRPSTETFAPAALR